MLSASLISLQPNIDDSDPADYHVAAPKPKPVFGVSLQKLRDTGQMRQGVPVVLIQMLEFLEQYGKRCAFESAPLRLVTYMSNEC